MQSILIYSGYNSSTLRNLDRYSLYNVYEAVRGKLASSFKLQALMDAYYKLSAFNVVKRKAWELESLKSVA